MVVVLNVPVVQSDLPSALPPQIPVVALVWMEGLVLVIWNYRVRAWETATASAVTVSIPFRLVSIVGEIYQ